MATIARLRLLDRARDGHAVSVWRELAWFLLWRRVTVAIDNCGVVQPPVTWRPVLPARVFGVFWVAFMCCMTVVTANASWERLVEVRMTAGPSVRVTSDGGTSFEVSVSLGSQHGHLRARTLQAAIECQTGSPISFTKCGVPSLPGTEPMKSGLHRLSRMQG